MYHTLFDSYEQAVDKAKNFVLRIVLFDGTVISSSPMPIPALVQVQEDVSNYLTKGVPLVSWDKSLKVLTSIPTGNIKMIQIVFE